MSENGSRERIYKMTTTAFDTLKYVKTLEKSGIPSEQAEAQAVALSGAMESNLVTKQDLNSVKTDLEHRIGSVAKDLTIKIYSVVAVGTGLIVSVVAIATGIIIQAIP